MTESTTPPIVSRTEIADLLADFFDCGGGGRQELLTAVADARPEVRAALEGLPERRYSGLRQLWEDLPRMPVEA